MKNNSNTVDRWSGWLLRVWQVGYTPLWPTYGAMESSVWKFFLVQIPIHTSITKILHWKCCQRSCTWALAIHYPSIQLFARILFHLAICQITLWQWSNHVWRRTQLKDRFSPPFYRLLKSFPQVKIHEKCLFVFFPSSSQIFQLLQNVMKMTNYVGWELIRT